MAADRFEGRRALVTGAGSGIGEAVARALHAEGAEVVLADAAGLEATVGHQPRYDTVSRAPDCPERTIASHTSAAR